MCRAKIIPPKKGREPKWIIKNTGAQASTSDQLLAQQSELFLQIRCDTASGEKAGALWTGDCEWTPPPRLPAGLPQHAGAPYAPATCTYDNTSHAGTQRESSVRVPKCSAPLRQRNFLERLQILQVRLWFVFPSIFRYHLSLSTILALYYEQSTARCTGKYISG